MAYFKGIKSSEKSKCGKIIVSGQIVKVRSRYGTMTTEQEVFFMSNHGFEICGNNLADADVIEVISSPNFFKRIYGVLSFAFFCLIH